MSTTATDRSTPRPRRGRDELAGRYDEVRHTSLALIDGLSAEDCVVQSMPLASPAKWHLAHTTWFFETFVLEAGMPGFRPFEADFRVLFNSYYNTIGEQYSRADRGLLTRPSLDRVLAYRRHVDDQIRRCLAEPGLARDTVDVAGLVEVGIHHEQQHQELLVTDVKHLLSRNPTHPVLRRCEESPVARPGPIEWVAFDEGVRHIGYDGEGFCFDNETPRHRVWLEVFRLASRPVTNAEYLEFIDDGGYLEPGLWLADGWAVAQREGWRHPAYWLGSAGRRMTFTASGLKELRLDEPVCHVSYYEAEAYARWRGHRLPTEAEWEVAASGLAVDGNFLDDGRLHPVPAAAGGARLEQMMGNVWEWTASPYVGYPGYRPLAGALGEYNGKFMCNQLVLRGGSCASPRSHLRTSYRNFFYPDARWQFSGIRLARDGA
ncbi:MAG TPA: ergothioneine biosynthesis protein EgtB [Candidatus Polarisedimenticolaceae bacterium]|nr:ergothioneine biosynthesis protein EgtB [Candidatus Polarisedimenticolaceae bacterium]